VADASEKDEASGAVRIDRSPSGHGTDGPGMQLGLIMLSDLKWQWQRIESVIGTGFF
jgi:hypothetical protein